MKTAVNNAVTGNSQNANLESSARGGGCFAGCITSQTFEVVKMWLLYVRCHVGPCHPGMARPGIANGGDGLQIWSVAANILNKQSWTVDKG
jgi:hypothetical protein